MSRHEHHTDHSLQHPAEPAAQAERAQQPGAGLTAEHSQADHAHGSSAGHAGEAGHDGHGDHAAQFRDKFWLSLALTVPVVAFSPMFADLLGYDVLDFPGAHWVSPVLGTIVFLYGGAPFLRGAVEEVKSRRPGMMLLIAMAITVAVAGYHLITVPVAAGVHAFAGISVSPAVAAILMSVSTVVVAANPAAAPPPHARRHQVADRAAMTHH